MVPLGLTQVTLGVIVCVGVGVDEPPGVIVGVFVIVGVMVFVGVVVWVGVIVGVVVWVGVIVWVGVGVGVLHSNSTPFNLKTLVLDTASIFDTLTQLTSDIFVITPIL